MRSKVAEFVTSLANATGQERMEFNRWLLSREPAIEFRLALEGEESDKAKWRAAQIEMLVGGQSLGRKRVAYWTDRMGIEAGHPGMEQLEAREQVGVDTVVTQIWVDAFCGPQEREARLQRAVEQNRAFAMQLRAPGGCLDGAEPRIIGA